MKAIKKTYENLKQVCESIVSVPLSLGSFEIDFSSTEVNVIRLVSVGRDGIGSSLLGLIPSNYEYRINFTGNSLYLLIWFD